MYFECQSLFLWLVSLGRKKGVFRERRCLFIFLQKLGLNLKWQYAGCQKLLMPLWQISDFTVKG